MADDELRTETSAADSTPEELSTPEQDTDQPETTEVEAEAEPTGEEEAKTEEVKTDDSKKLSKRAENRFRNLANKVRELETQKQPDIPPEFTPPWMREQHQPLVQPGQELTPEEYEQHIVAKANAIVELQMSRYQQQMAQQRKAEEAALKLDKETQEIESKYGELNPDSEHYNEKLSERIIKQVKRELSRNPYASVKEIVEDLMAIREDGRNRGASEVTESTIRQMSEGAVTPSGRESSGTKDPKEMSLEEIAAQVGYAE